MKQLPNHLKKLALHLYSNNLGENADNNILYLENAMKQLPNHLLYLKLDITYNNLRQ